MAHRLSRSILPLLLFLSLYSCKTRTYLSKIDTERITVDESAQAEVDARIAALINPYKTELDEKMNLVIGTLTTDLEKETPEGTLNNWMTDIIHNRAEVYYGKPVDFTLQNYGGIRIKSIPAGPIDVRKIYELMPFDNKVVILELNAELMYKMFERIASDGGWPVSKEVRLKINPDKTINELLINGAPIQEDKIYHMALPDYVANGGGGCDFLKPLKQFETGWNVREAIIDYLKSNMEPMTVHPDGRISIIE